MIYLDNSATTKPNSSVLQSFNDVSLSFFANPSSIHELGGAVERLLTKAREQTAELLQVNSSEIVFTSGGTEGNNMAIKGIALQHQQRGKHIITSEIEHSSVFEACQSLEKLGFEVTYLPVNTDGVISISELEAAIKDDTILISVMHVNNELGSIQPIEEIGNIAKKHPKLYFHVDDVQGLGKIPLQLSNSGIDLCTYSGHKIHGLKGTGILYKSKRTTLFPLFHGGSQEASIRSGTENVAGSVSIARALRLAKENELEAKQHLCDMQSYLRAELAKIKGVIINTSKQTGAPHILNVSVPGLKPEVIIHMLSEQGIFISTRSACSSKTLNESRILTACGFNKDRASSALRISLSAQNTKDEITTFTKELAKVVNKLQKVME